MNNSICVTCGTRFTATDGPPDGCPICLDDRQYVNPNGQTWTTLERMRAAGHRNVFTELEPGITGIVTEPKFAIGQRAHLIATPFGNVLWDCVTWLDDATVAEIQRRGGLAGIAISHPHFFTTIIEWARAFDAPVWLHRDHQPWVMEPGPEIRYWDGETQEVVPGVTAIRCGGHFPGSTALHWAGGGDGQGLLFTSDTIYVVADNRWVTFIYSYPNDIPLGVADVRRIAAAVRPFPFERLYGAFGRPVERDANAAVQRSAERYVAHIQGAARSSSPRD